MILRRSEREGILVSSRSLESSLDHALCRQVGGKLEPSWSVASNPVAIV